MFNRVIRHLARWATLNPRIKIVGGRVVGNSYVADVRVRLRMGGRAVIRAASVLAKMRRIVPRRLRVLALLASTARAAFVVCVIPAVIGLGMLHVAGNLAERCGDWIVYGLGYGVHDWCDRYALPRGLRKVISRG